MTIHDDIMRAIQQATNDGANQTADYADAILASGVIDKVRAEAVEYVAQIAEDTLRMCQRGGAGEKNILPPEKEAGFQLCIDNIANLAKSMKEDQS